jgi:glycine/serine hydroxymethyltransferase
MGPAEMAEIAKVVKRVLSQTTPAKTKSGTPSQAKYELATAVKTEAEQRVTALLNKHPLYPELGDVE